MMNSIQPPSQVHNGPKIAIIGAGPAGLTLARLLQHLSSSSLPFNVRPAITILESDASPRSRDQGGSLDLHPEGGQAALKLAGLLPQFQAVCRPEGEVLKIYLPTGRLIMDEGKNPESQARPKEMHDRPEIDRHLLRKILLESLDPDTVKWGVKVLSVETKDLDDGRRVFNIRTKGSQPQQQQDDDDDDDDDEVGGEEEGFLQDYDLVIGADGAFSRIRGLVTSARPYFSGIAGLDVQMHSVDTTRPDQAFRCGHGMCLTLGNNRGILSQRSGGVEHNTTTTTTTNNNDDNNDDDGGGGGKVRTYAFIRMAAEDLDGEDWDDKCGIDFTDMKTAIPLFVERFYPGWDEGARKMVLDADVDTAMARTMWMLKPGLRWDSRAGVTLLGDAAHLMTPFAGVGVNVAMQDSLELAQRIMAHLMNGTDDLNMTDAIKEYEVEMFARAEMYAKKTLVYLDLFFHERGGVAMVEHFDRVKADEKMAAAATAAVDVGGDVGGDVVEGKIEIGEVEVSH